MHKKEAFDCHNGDNFKHLMAVKLPDLLEFRLIKSIKLEECQFECLKNCSCTTYASSDIRAGGSACLLWYGDLIEVREAIQEDNGQDINIRLRLQNLVCMLLVFVLDKYLFSLKSYLASLE